MEMENTSTLAIRRANRPIVAETDFVCVAALRQKLENLIQDEIELRIGALDRVEMVFQNNVRIGWCLLDIKELLRGDFTLYAQNNLPFSERSARRLMQGAKMFTRDLENANFVMPLNSGLTYQFCKTPLIEQIRELRKQPDGPRYFNDLLVTSGLAPARQAGNETPNNASGFFKLTRAIDNAAARLIRYQREVPADNWSADDWEIIKRKLKPFKEFYEDNL